jgi:hypothetical protein
VSRKISDKKVVEILRVAIHTVSLVASSASDRKSVGWISIADTGDVSAGLSDRNLVIARPGGEKDGSRNPHFTFHPPIYHHLRSDGEAEILAGLMEIGLMLQEGSSVPWVRLISRPYEELKAFGGARKGNGVLAFHIENPALSAEVELDFVRPAEVHPEHPRFKYARVNSGMALRVGVQSVPPARPSLTLLWQG